MSVQEIIKQRRIELNLTMKDLAKRVGVSEGTISRWESGDIANMRRDKIVALANALHITPSVIMEWDDSEYYANQAAARAAQAAFDDPDLRALFDAARDSKPEDIRMAADMLRRFKETNPDG